MKVLNIHGYHGTPQNAAYGALVSNGFDDVITPEIDYDAKTPETVLDELCNIVTENKIGLLVGTSLGGFFAAVLSARTQLPVILINPCLMPFLHLPELGYNDEITPFIPMFGTLDKLDINKVSCIVGDDDEIISTHAFTEKLLNNPRFRRIPGGHHSGATLPLVDYFAEVLPKR
ncbi:MAG: hypothetical protein IIZ09_08270 [Ruminococcus sp.]|nr:hypothetical protein [Ruminococcus sp.]